MIKISNISGMDFMDIHELSGRIKGIVQHPAHIYKIMADHFGDTFFVAKEKDENSDERLMGFMMGFISHVIKGHLFVWQIAVSPAAQGKGVGSKLLAHTIEFAQSSEECSSVMATVETDNYASQSLFEKFNFKIKSGYFKDEYQELTTTNQKEAVKNYYGSSTDQIFYALDV